jgi:lipopolysaccharide export system permease protein
MTILSRYLVRQNLFLLFSILLIGIGLYMLTDMFERLDTFIESGAGAAKILTYFLCKSPSIISQILPAVYLLAMVVQLNMLERGRELIALTAGGVPPTAFVRFLLVYGLIWAVGQFLFAQVIGVAGEKASNRIWQEDVRGNAPEEASLKSLWFTEKNRIVFVKQAWPVQKRGQDILIYTLDATGIGITEIIKAKSFVAEGDAGWLLRDGSRLIPAKYSTTPFETMTVPLTQNLRAFQVGSKSSSIRPNQLSPHELSDIIQRLEQAGSNVEKLRTAWHGKLSYACSLLIMGLLAYGVSRFTSNIYAAVVCSLLLVFFFYALNTFATTLGERGAVPPPVGAWFADIFFCLGGLLWLARERIRRLL